MQTFRVDDMTCGHCVRAITQALQATDKEAQVSIDLAQHLVTVAPVAASVQQLSDAIAAAGYTPVPLAATAPAAKPTRAGGCCGCCG